MTKDREPRTRRAWRALAIGVALGLIAGAAPAAGARDLADQLKRSVRFQPSGQQLGFAAPAEREGPLSLDQAVAKVRKLHPKAEIVGAETRDTERGRVHVVKALRQNGKIKVYRFDADTGAMLD